MLCRTVLVTLVLVATPACQSEEYIRHYYGSDPRPPSEPQSGVSDYLTDFYKFMAGLVMLAANSTNDNYDRDHPNRW